MAGLEDRIRINLEVRSGKPTITGTRNTVYDILEYLAGGVTEEMRSLRTSRASSEKTYERP